MSPGVGGFRFWGPWIKLLNNCKSFLWDLSELPKAAPKKLLESILTNRSNLKEQCTFYTQKTHKKSLQIDLKITSEKLPTLSEIKYIVNKQNKK
jgi:hypothetical protein